MAPLGQQVKETRVGCRERTRRYREGSDGWEKVTNPVGQNMETLRTVWGRVWKSRPERRTERVVKNAPRTVRKKRTQVILIWVDLTFKTLHMNCIFMALVYDRWLTAPMWELLTLKKIINSTCFKLLITRNVCECRQPFSSHLHRCLSSISAVKAPLMISMENKDEESVCLEKSLTSQ